MVTDPTASAALERSTPERDGVESGALLALVDALDEPGLGLHSLMVVRHDRVIAEGWWGPYDATRAHLMFSVSKSLTATAVGIAEAEGRLSIDEPILDFFPSYATPEVAANVRGLRLRHLLAMATGHAVDTMPVMRALPHEDWVRIFLGIPIVYPPGTHFLYNSGASFMLSAAIASRTGQGLRDYLLPRVFEPLGIATPAWQANGRGIYLGSSGLRLRTEDMAKVGLLYLRDGVWRGHRLLPAAWVAAAGSLQVENGSDADLDWGQGYGFQFWRSRHDSYRADGAFGQFILIVPGQDLVVAVTAGTGRSREIPGLVWKHLLPGLHEAPLPGDPATHRRLSARLTDLALDVPDFLAADPAGVESIDGRTIELPFTTVGAAAIRLTFGRSTITFDMVGTDGNIESTTAGRDSWVAGRTVHWPHEEMSEVVTFNRAGWTDPQTLEIHQQCVETPFRRVWTIRLPRGEVDLRSVEVDVGLDLGFWDARTERLSGRIDERSG